MKRKEIISENYVYQGTVTDLFSPNISLAYVFLYTIDMLCKARTRCTIFTNHVSHHSSIYLSDAYYSLNKTVLYSSIICLLSQWTQILRKLLKKKQFPPKKISTVKLHPSNLVFKISSSVYRYYRIHPLKVYLMVFRKTAWFCGGTVEIRYHTYVNNLGTLMVIFIRL